MWGTIAGVWKGLTAFFGFGEQVAKNINDTNQQDAGAAKQKAADQDAVLAEVKEARDAEADVDRKSDAELDRLRDAWTKKP